VSIFKEFREFVSRGNVVDLAVGVIIGGAFNAVVKSLVEQVVMPPIGLATSGIDFAKLEWVIKPENLATKHAAVAIQYLNTIIQFLITAAAVFALVKLVNTLRRQQAETPSVPPAPTASEALLTEIRDLLKAGK
jgi:large conductance mechanosensitive channel